jgi:hypothetical protein
MTDFTGLDSLDYSFVDDELSHGGDARIAEQSLWCAVINLAISDALDGKSAARDWLLTERDDFVLVCSLAGVSPFSVRTAARRLTARNA